MGTLEFILFVSDQVRSIAFYEKPLRIVPSLNVPGMMEFPSINSKYITLKY